MSNQAWYKAVFLALHCSFCTSMTSPNRQTPNSKLFAGDTICQCPISTKEVEALLQNDLDKLSLWEDRWNMSFLPEKFQIFHINRSWEKLVRQYYLQEVNHTKFLGVLLASDATLEAHINTVTNKASRTLGLLRQTLEISAKSVKEQAYESFVRPVFKYTFSIWDPHNIKDIKSLKATQKRAACLTLLRYCRTSGVNDMLTALDRPSLQSRHRCTTLFNFYKFHNGLVTINSKYTPTQQASVRRPCQTHPLSYPLPSCRTDCGKYSYFLNTIVDWNSLPEDVATAPTLRSFQSRLSSILNWVPIK